MQLDPCTVASDGCCAVRDRLQMEAADLRVAIRVAQIGMWRRDLVTDALVWSAELHALFGTDAAVYYPTVEGALLLVHPDDRAMVRSYYARAIIGEAGDYEFRVPQPDGSVQWRQTVLRTERDASGKLIALRGVVQDVTERKRASEHIHHLAHFDVLTGLANRTKLATSLRQHLGRAKRTGAAMAVLAIDLDGFKAVNDLLGYAAGDKLLQVVASRLRANVREVDTVARLGGDEFVVILGGRRSRKGRCIWLSVWCSSWRCR